jgi:putative ABC transport system permease protein
MTAMGFAWRSLIRQPARGGLAVLGVAAIGALLFDMLMLSQGLVTSMRDLLERTGWDVRVTAAEEEPAALPLIPQGADVLARVRGLPSVRSAVGVRRVPATIIKPGATPGAEMLGVTGDIRPWTVVEGRDVRSDRELVVSERIAVEIARIGEPLTLQASCLDGRESLPAVTFDVVGVAEFPLRAVWENGVGSTLPALEHACGGNEKGGVTMLLVAAAGDPAATARAIELALPELAARTNDDLIGRFQQNGFTYFRQISTVLTTVTVAFALLLITVLLTVSVNQRLGEIAALRALGFSRRRVVADVLSESALIVGSGGVLSLPLGMLLAEGLDRILTSMPGLPADLHFFVFQPQALVTHVILLVVTAIAAALYPMQIVARLPIASTLRDEVIG